MAQIVCFRELSKLGKDNWTYYGFDWTRLFFFLNQILVAHKHFVKMKHLYKTK